MKNNMMVIGGNSIQELELNLEAMKKAMAAGTTAMVVGGTSTEDIEKGMKVLSAMLGNTPSPTIIEEDEWVEDDLESEYEEEEEYSELDADVIADLIIGNDIDIYDVLVALTEKLEEHGNDPIIREKTARYLGGEVACGNTTISDIIADIEDEI